MFPSVKNILKISSNKAVGRSRGGAFFLLTLFPLGQNEGICDSVNYPHDRVQNHERRASGHIWETVLIKLISVRGTIP